MGNREKELSYKFAVARKAIEGKDVSTGYEINGRKYCDYDTETAFREFVDAMEPAVRDQLCQRERKKCKYPPQMASYGSSSRMFYELVKNIKGNKDFVFEKKLGTCIGGVANLDLFIENKTIFVEVKCKEFYAGLNHQISNAYECLYKHLSKYCDEFSYKVENASKAGYSKITFKWDNEPIGNFDLKQIICHFAAITNWLLNLDERPINGVKFIYLVYNPDKEIGYLRGEDKEASQEIQEKYKEEKEVIERIGENGFRLIFKCIMKYFCEKCNRCAGDIETLAGNFTFICCDQYDFAEKIDN